MYLVIYIIHHIYLGEILIVDNCIFLDISRGI